MPKQKNSQQRLKYRYLMRKIFTELEVGGWKVEVVRFVEYNQPEKLLGFIEPWTRTIYIDIRSELILTLAHEVLHAVFYKYTEKAICSLEEFIRSRLTHGDLLKLISYLMTKDGLLRKHFPIFNVNYEP